MHLAIRRVYFNHDDSAILRTHRGSSLCAQSPAAAPSAPSAAAAWPGSACVPAASDSPWLASAAATASPTTTRASCRWPRASRRRASRWRGRGRARTVGCRHSSRRAGLAVPGLARLRTENPLSFPPCRGESCGSALAESKRRRTRCRPGELRFSGSLHV